MLDNEAIVKREGSESMNLRGKEDTENRKMKNIM